MRILSWNCQAMGNPLTIHHLKGICKSHSLDVVFLIETKNKEHVVHKWLIRCNFVNVTTINPVDLAGGLCCAWKNNVSVTILKWNSFMFYTTVLDNRNRCDWDLLCMHVNSDESVMKNKLILFLTTCSLLRVLTL